MFRYLLRKSGYAVIVMWGVVSLVFFLFHVLPADPARLLMGQRTDKASIENTRKLLNLDKPLYVRYLYYLNDLSPLSIYQDKDYAKEAGGLTVVGLGKEASLYLKFPYLGRSYRSQRSVTALLTDALPGTIVLAFSAMLLASVFGVALGIVAAMKRGTFLDSFITVGSVTGISVPSFFAGLLLAYFLGYKLHGLTGLNMSGSLWSYDPFTGRTLSVRNLILPAIALGVRPLAIIAQLTRSSMLDTLSMDFIKTARAKGLPERKVVLKHALPNALNPVITAITGWLAELLAGSFFIEYIFGWKGVGKVTVDALDKFDFPVVMGSVLLSASIFIVVSLATDILYSVIDPRVKMA